MRVWCFVLGALFFVMGAEGAWFSQPGGVSETDLESELAALEQLSLEAGIRGLEVSGTNASSGVYVWHEDTTNFTSGAFVITSDGVNPVLTAGGDYHLWRSGARQWKLVTSRYRGGDTQDAAWQRNAEGVEGTYVGTGSPVLRVSTGDFPAREWDLGSVTNVTIEAIAPVYYWAPTNAASLEISADHPRSGFTVNWASTNSLSIPAGWNDPFDCASNMDLTGTNVVFCIWPDAVSGTNWNWASRWVE